MKEGGRNIPEGFAEKIVGWLGAYLISFVGLLHLLLAGEHFGFATYLGILFLLNFAVCAAAAVGLARTGARWAWLLGAAICAGSAAALLWSRIVGLPGYPEGVGQWFNFPAWMSLAFEFPFLAVVPLGLTSRGRALVQAEQGRIDREKLPPASQETAEHFDLIEREMWEIRHRMSHDVRDLQSHLTPQALRKQTRRNARTRLDGLVDRLRRR